MNPSKGSRRGIYPSPTGLTNSASLSTLMPDYLTDGGAANMRSGGAGSLNIQVL